MWDTWELWLTKRCMLYDVNTHVARRCFSSPSCVLLRRVAHVPLRFCVASLLLPFRAFVSCGFVPCLAPFRYCFVPCFVPFRSCAASLWLLRALSRVRLSALLPRPPSRSLRMLRYRVFEATLSRCFLAEFGKPRLVCIVVPSLGRGAREGAVACRSVLFCRFAAGDGGVMVESSVIDLAASCWCCWCCWYD